MSASGSASGRSMGGQDPGGHRAPSPPSDQSPPTSPVAATPDQLRRQVHDLSERAALLSSQLRIAREARDTALRGEEHAQRTLVRSTQDLRACERVCDRQQEEIARLQDEVVHLQSRSDPGGDQPDPILQFRQRADRQAAIVSDLERELRHVSRQRDGYRGDCDRLAREMRLAGDEAETAQEERHEAELALEHANHELRVSGDLLERLRDDLHAIENEAAIRSAQLDQARAAAAAGDSTHGELQRLRDALARTDSDRDLARSELAVALADRAKLDADLGQKTQDLARLQGEVVGLNGHVTDLGTFSCLSLRLVDLELTQLASTGGDLDAARRTISRLQHDLADLSDRRSALARDHNAVTIERDVALQRLAIVATAVGASPPRLANVQGDLAPHSPEHRSSAEADVPDQGAPPVDRGSDLDEPDSVPQGGQPDPEHSGSGSPPHDPSEMSGVLDPDGGSGNQSNDYPGSADPASLKHPRSRSPSSGSSPRRPHKKARPVAIEDEDGREDSLDIDDDGGQDQAFSDQGSEDPEHPPEDESERSSGSNQHRSRSSSSDKSGDVEVEGDEEDSAEAEDADEAFDQDTLRALAQSRSEDRRHKHATPPRRSSLQQGAGGSGDPPGSPAGSDHGGGSPAPGSDHGGGSPRHDATSPASDLQLPANTTLPAAPFGPDAICIPGRSRRRVMYMQDVEPWIVRILNQSTIMDITIAVLFPTLPIRPGWMFPTDETAMPPLREDQYCEELITEQNVRDLLATRPWEVLENAGQAITFDPAAAGRLGQFAREYLVHETRDLQTYWESTHSFPISKAKCSANPWLARYRKSRSNRRGHAGTRWKHVLWLLILAMRDGWCDLDVLLDIYFLHFPTRSEKVTWYPGVVSRLAKLANPLVSQDEPTTLLEALDECNEADPWRNHFRDSPQDHPAYRLTRIAGKFLGVHPATPATP
uniref:Uncharacterized protein n=1 Tax=Phytophthora ramorum TaxID=164328 RepID=H3GZT1_PHYRM